MGVVVPDPLRSEPHAEVAVNTHRHRHSWTHSDTLTHIHSYMQIHSHIDIRHKYTHTHRDTGPHTLLHTYTLSHIHINTHIHTQLPPPPSECEVITISRNLAGSFPPQPPPNLDPIKAWWGVRGGKGGPGFHFESSLTKSGLSGPSMEPSCHPSPKRASLWGADVPATASDMGVDIAPLAPPHPGQVHSPKQQPKPSHDTGGVVSRKPVRWDLGQKGPPSILHAAPLEFRNTRDSRNLDQPLTGCLHTWLRPWHCFPCTGQWWLWAPVHRGAAFRATGCRS